MILRQKIGYRLPGHKKGACAGPYRLNAPSFPGVGGAPCAVSHHRGELGYCDCLFPIASPAGEENNVHGAYVQGEDGGHWWSDLGRVSHLQKVGLDQLPLHKGGPVSFRWRSITSILLSTPPPPRADPPAHFPPGPSAQLSSAQLRPSPAGRCSGTWRKGKGQTVQTPLPTSPRWGFTKRWSAGVRGPPTPRELSSEGQRDLRLRVAKGTSGSLRRKNGRSGGWEPGGALAPGSLLPSSNASGEKAEPSHFPLAVYF